MPDVLSTSPFTPSALQQAVAAELAAAPANALTATVTYLDHGTVKSTVAVRIDRDRWVLGIGGFVERRPEGWDAGAFGSVTVRF